MGTFLATVALGGDNVAVWTPLLRAGNFVHGGVVLAVFAGCQILFVSFARRLVLHPRITQWGEKVGHWALPVVYVLLGVVILLETGVI
jgi:cadmium resistance protein CadD (predicted permease)